MNRGPHKQRTPIIRLLLIMIFAFFLSGCLSVPDNVLVVSGSGDTIQDRSTRICDSIKTVDAVGGIDPDGFSILSWNSHKGAHPDWNRDLGAYGETTDFILLQETALDGALRESLEVLNFQWQLAVAFELDEKEIGVMTAGRVPATEYCAFRENESIIKLPKMILGTLYPIHGTDAELLIVNAHIVNFTFGSDLVRKQVDAIKEKIRSHHGPVIVAGDFNTWSGQRKAVIREGMQELELLPVTFDPDQRTEFFGRIVDGVFYRGLEVVQSRSLQAESSDHNPLEVHFRLAGDGETR